MNRKSKVIVSIVGITIVLLALLGITYAYYLTRIEGNTNTNSISITTADLKLVYSENSPEIITENNIIPGTTIGEKTFTVSNTGNTLVEDYKVVLEYAVIENVVPSVFVRPQDFEITMTCVSKNIQTDEESGTCSGYTGTWNNESFEMTTNDIAENIKHEYSLTIVYVNQETIDQSDDMGKNLNLKVQIYGANETSTITGTIDNVDETYAMKLNSNPKISTIKNVGTKENPKYQYKFIGVEHNSGDDSHTLTLVNKSNLEQSTGNITIKKGTNANIDGSTITVKDNQTNIYLTTSKGESLTSTATFNPYSNNTNSLAYHIINNAINNQNGSLYVDLPLSKVAEEASTIKNYKPVGEESPFKRNADISYYANNPLFYYDTYVVDNITGKFTLSGKKSCVYNDCYANLEGKYLAFSSENSNGNFIANSHVEESKKNLPFIYKIISTTSTTISYVPLFNSINEAERVLSKTFDDYGTSYYYRGGVIDNYVNFAGMCWRIVRIQGDGSVKLVLEDKEYECNNQSFTGNWSDGNEYIYSNNNKYIADFINSNLVNSFKTFQNTLVTKIGNTYTNQGLADKLKVEQWCFDNNIASSKTYCEDWEEDGIDDYCYTNKHYGAYERLMNNSASLNCSGTKYTKFNDGTDMYVATLNADEIVYAGTGRDIGGDYKKGSYNNYLINSYSRYGAADLYFWSLSPERYYGTYNADGIFVFGDGGFWINEALVIGIGYSRPVVTLKYGTIITGGDGTQSNPYVIG